MRKTILIFCFFVIDASALELFADRAEYNTFHREAEFLDNVKVIFNGATMTTNRIVVNLEDDSFEIAGAVADGEVFVETAEETATSNRAIYNAKDHLLTLLEDVRIDRDGVKITSSTYTIDTETRDSNLGNGDGQRVKIKIQ